VKLKAYEAEYVLEYIDATSLALDDALSTLATDEREEKDKLIERATGMKLELAGVSELIRSKGILTQEEKEQRATVKMNKDIEAAIGYEEESV
jgi:hypothetical protein